MYIHADFTETLLISHSKLLLSEGNFNTESGMVFGYLYIKSKYFIRLFLRHFSNPTFLM